MVDNATSTAHTKKNQQQTIICVTNIWYKLRTAGHWYNVTWSLSTMPSAACKYVWNTQFRAGSSSSLSWGWGFFDCVGLLDDTLLSSTSSCSETILLTSWLILEINRKNYIERKEYKLERWQGTSMKELILSQQVEKTPSLYHIFNSQFFLQQVSRMGKYNS